jgi:hypothetical protein
MEPNTASKLRERRSNSLNDYIQVAGQFNVNNYLVFSETSKINLTIGKHPQGPTLYFTVNNYTLSKELNQFNKFTTPPLLILNGFTSKDKHVMLMASMFQNMFPTLNVSTVSLSPHIPFPHVLLILPSPFSLPSPLLPSYSPSPFLLHSFYPTFSIHSIPHSPSNSFSHILLATHSTSNSFY